MARQFYPIRERGHRWNLDVQTFASNGFCLYEVYIFMNSHPPVYKAIERKKMFWVKNFHKISLRMLVSGRCLANITWGSEEQTGDRDTFCNLHRFTGLEEIPFHFLENKELHTKIRKLHATEQMARGEKQVIAHTVCLYDTRILFLSSNCLIIFVGYTRGLIENRYSRPSANYAVYIETNKNNLLPWWTTKELR